MRKVFGEISLKWMKRILARELSMYFVVENNFNGSESKLTLSKRYLYRKFMKYIF